MDRALVPVGAHGTNTNIAAAFTLTPPAGAYRLVIQALGQNVRYTLDGTAPTATVGFVLAAGDTALIQLGARMTIRVIQEAAGAAIAYQWGE